MKKEKRVYQKPAIKEKKMTAYFMICAVNAIQCGPCTQIKQFGVCPI